MSQPDQSYSIVFPEDNVRKGNFMGKNGMPYTIITSLFPSNPWLMFVQSFRYSSRMCLGARLAKRHSFYTRFMSQDFSRQTEKDSEYKQFERILDDFTRNGEYDLLVQHIDDAKQKGQSPGKYKMSYLIASAIKSGNRFHALELLGRYNENFVDTDPHPYTPVLQNLIDNQLFQDAEKLWGSMEDRNIQVDEVNYAQMIQGYIIQKKNDEAFHCIEQMLTKRITPSTQTCNSWLRRFVAASDLTHVLKLWKTMKDNNVKLDTKSYNMILQAHVQNKHTFVNRVNQISSEMKANNVTFDIFTYQHLIRLFSIKKRVGKVNALHKEMQEQQIPVNGIIFMDLINAFAKSETIDEAEKLVIDTPRHAFEDKFWLIGMSKITQFHAAHGNYRRVQVLLDKIEFMGLNKDAIMMLGIITGLNSAGEDKHATEVFKACRTMFNKDQTSIIYNSFAKCYAEQGESSDCVMAIEALEHLQAPVQVSTYISLLFCHLKCQDTTQAEKLSSFILSECQPHLRDCIKVVDNFIQLKEHHLCRLWIDYMCDKNYYPSNWYIEDREGKIRSKKQNRKIGSTTC